MRYCRSCQTTYPNEVLTCPKDGNATSRLSEVQGDPYVGKFAGSYQIIEKLGEGGMGVVYLAKHPSLGKRAAVKFLNASIKDRGKAIERFFSEAQIVSQLGHENIVDVYDFGLLEESQPYLVMEYLEGEPLSALQNTMGLIEPKLAISIITQLLDALAAAHKRGVIHRDLKPDNVFLLRRRERYMVKLLDFGIAKLGEASDLDSNRKQLTKTGMVIGTPHYMSPEQAQGLTLDARSDLYSTGVLLFELLCGRPPFMGSNMASLVLGHVSKAPPAPRSLRPELPASLEVEILKSLSKTPAERHQSADEMAQALIDSLKPPAAVSEPTTTPQIVRPTSGDSGAYTQNLLDLPTAANIATPPPQTPPPVEVQPKPSAPSAPNHLFRLALVLVPVFVFGFVWYWMAPPNPTQATQSSQPASVPTPTLASAPSTNLVAPVEMVELRLISKVKGAEVRVKIGEAQELKSPVPFQTRVPKGSPVEILFSSKDKRWKKKLTAIEDTEINWVVKEDKVDMKGTLPLDLKKK